MPEKGLYGCHIVDQKLQSLYPRLPVVEWYHGDQVLRQFSCIQYIPDPPCKVGEVHGMNKRGKQGLHWRG
ncbi:hypothetical protein J1N35_009921 [Gossypium stocksii]|uniref:Uncharacterized protein n=1 Tax=Gossypium stocksii TaxID=47602 RepID=A0A9D4ABT6_9ROSI|nr:hypothetical protein J1N35_009921 [Gossypium stocksii]